MSHFPRNIEMSPKPRDCPLLRLPPVAAFSIGSHASHLLRGRRCVRLPQERSLICVRLLLFTAPRVFRMNSSSFISPTLKWISREPGDVRSYKTPPCLGWRRRSCLLSLQEGAVSQEMPSLPSLQFLRPNPSPWPTLISPYPRTLPEEVYMDPPQALQRCCFIFLLPIPFK